MSELIDVAEELVTELNGSGLSAGPVVFTAERIYLPDFELRDLQDLQVVVVMKEQNPEPATRNKLDYEYAYDIGVLKHLLDKDNATIDPLMDLVSDIMDFFFNKKLTGVPNVQWVRLDNKPMYWPDHMQRLSQFTSVVNLFYRSIR